MISLPDHESEAARVAAGLRAAMLATGITENRLATLSGVGQSTINRLAAQQVAEPKRATISKIEAALGVPAGGLFSMEPDDVAQAARAHLGTVPALARGMAAILKASSPNLAATFAKISTAADQARVLGVHGVDIDAPADGDAMIPVVDARLHAGDGSLIEFVEVDRSIGYRTAWLKRKGADAAKCYVFKAAGPSMEPTILDGDLVLIDTQRQRVTDGDIFAVLVGGVPKIKRLRTLRDGSLVIESDNPRFAPETIPAEEVGDTVLVIGRAISRSGDL